MRTFALAAIAFGALALTAPAAHAAPQYQGGCRFVAGTDPTGQVANPNTYTGVIYAAIVGHDDDPAGNPATFASVQCHLLVNGVIADSTATFAGPGVAAGAEDASYVALDGDVVQLCWDVTIATGTGTASSSTCATAIHIEVPPQLVWDIVDPIVCEILKQVAPVTNPILPRDLTWFDPDQGDWYVANSLFYDCPPYGV